ncbi:MAG: cbb3-type cytochrome c oxidase subunit 3 [Burkholderiales bacterium]|jgi:cbb3-type cytochrome oxidase subunit 3
MQILGMDTINLLRSAVTVAAFTTFIGITLWAWSGSRRASFAEASRIPFEDDELDKKTGLQAKPDAERSSK